jgi:nitrite reductase/ring-hydroxylating ferredoxin subunit
VAERDLEADLDRLERIVGSFENEPDAAVRERALELIESVDVVHRQLVWAVGQAVHARSPELFESLLEDPLASVLFEMYGLVAPSRAAPDDTPAMLVGLDDLLATIPAPFSWFTAASSDEVRDDALLSRDVEGERVLIVRLADGARAYVDRCPGSPLTLNAGVVRDGVLLCPWHDCRFDLATGRRLDREGEGLAPLQVAESAGEVKVGMRSKRHAA